MNLDIKSWKEFKLCDIVEIQYGNKFDNDKMTHENPQINFVGRSNYNNGVADYVDKIENAQIFLPGCITIALGGSLGSCFIQTKQFYTAQNVAVLLTEHLSYWTKLFLCTIIANECKIKYHAFGRELNKYIKKTFSIKLPVNNSGTPDWQFMEDYIKSLHSKKITTKNNNKKKKIINVSQWKWITLSDYFEIEPGNYHSSEEFDDGITPYYSASKENNGIKQFIDLPPDFKGNKIVTGKIGCTAFYAPSPFCATADVNVFTPNFNMTPYIAIFIVNVINYSENYKWAYGRQCRVGNSKKIKIKLPVKSDGTPDWQFMEDYIKSLPYGDRI